MKHNYVFMAMVILSLSACGSPEKGAAGPAGPTGPAGVDGVNGSDGVNGADGQDGLNGADGMNGADGADGANAVPPTVTIYQFPVVNTCLLLEGAYVKRTSGASLEWHLAAGCGDAALFSSKQIVQLSGNKLLYVGTLASDPSVMTATVVAYQ